MTFGITGFGYELGEHVPVEPAALAGQHPAVQRWGYRGFHRAADTTGLTDLAVAAAERALGDAGVRAEELDLVVLAMSDVAEYLYWDPAAAVQHRIGARAAEAVLVNQACGGGVTAFDTVAGRFATHGDHRTALIVGANRVCERVVNRFAANTCVNGDGAAAAVVRRGARRCRWLGTETVTDGRYADFVRLGHDETVLRNPYDRLEEAFDRDLAQMVEFAAMVPRRAREVFDRACVHAGVDRDAVRRVLHLNDNQRALIDLAEALGLPVDRTNADLAAEHGHLGCADQLHSLAVLVGSGAVSAGDVVALTSIGSGMHWTCTLVEV